MLIQFQDYLTFENIYFWANFGILPFWLLIIFVPNSNFTQVFVNSIIIPLIISAAYIYIIYQAILVEESFFDIFNLYIGLNDLHTLFATESFLLIFWLHFLGINLFLGSWVSREGVKYNISRTIVSIPLILIYLTGPFGLVLFWLLRVFYSKKLSFHD